MMTITKIESVEIIAAGPAHCFVRFKIRLCNGAKIVATTTAKMSAYRNGLKIKNETIADPMSAANKKYTCDFCLFICSLV